VAHFKNHPSSCLSLKRPRETLNDLSQDSLPLDRELNPGPPECDTEVPRLWISGAEDILISFRPDLILVGVRGMTTF
jgi:hypothetical protein